MERPPAVRKTLEVVSDPWSFAVLQETFYGVRRFEQFQRNLQISRAVLTKRLRHLVEHDILERVQYQSRPDRYEYRLTQRGRELYPVFVSLMHWGERWLDAEGVPLVHESCGLRSRPRMACDRCGEEIDAREMRYELEAEEAA